MTVLINKNDEVFFNADEASNISKDEFLRMANNELAEIASQCRRKAEEHINTDHSHEVFASFGFCLIGLALCIGSIFIDNLGFIALLLLGLFALAGGIGGAIYNIKKIGLAKKALLTGKLYCGKLIYGEAAMDSALYSFYMIKYTFEVEDKTIMHTQYCTKKALDNLKSKSFLFIAYDKTTKKSVPVRLFLTN